MPFMFFPLTKPWLRFGRYVEIGKLGSGRQATTVAILNPRCVRWRRSAQHPRRIRSCPETGNTRNGSGEDIRSPARVAFTPWSRTGEGLIATLWCNSVPASFPEVLSGVLQARAPKKSPAAANARRIFLSRHILRATRSCAGGTSDS